MLVGTLYFSQNRAPAAVAEFRYFQQGFESLNEKNSEVLVDLRDVASYSHWTRVTIRFGDEDRLGHVNNAAYAVWFEAARIGYFESLYAPKIGLDTVLARLLIDYVQETRFPGDVDVGSRLLSMGNKSIRSGYAVFRDGQCLATSECVNVFFDPQSRTSTIPAPAIRLAMEEEIARLQS
ncbi:MAG: acyl-CoA thioester hydrolase [Gammaproteobacteria bacterium]